MALNLVHPALLYVLFQLLILDHLRHAPAFLGRSPVDPVTLGVYGAQFLGAWTVFYTTLLRDMGLRSTWGTVLLLTSLVAVVSQYFLFPEPARTEPAPVWWFLGVQIVLSCTGWVVTMIHWRQGKRAWEAERAQAQGGLRP